MLRNTGFHQYLPVLALLTLSPRASVSYPAVVQSRILLTPGHFKTSL